MTLLRSYVLFLRDNAHLADSATSALMVKHVHDLAAVAIGATGDGEAIARGRGVRAARLNAIKTFALRHLSSQDLSVVTIAHHFKLTPRYIHMLFEAEGVTFSTFVIEHRLLSAHRMLTAAHSSELSISAIAFASGFSDLSHFNRSFR